MIFSKTKLLVSVCDAIEAVAALEGGADLIDVKDPTRGALGKADDTTIASVLEAVAGRRPVTAALGELTENNQTFFSNASRVNELAYIKVGLAKAPTNWASQLEKYYEPYASPIVVAYADCLRCDAPPVQEVIQWAIEHQVAGVLLDTFVKDGRSLFEAISSDEIIVLRKELHSHHIKLAVAGALRGRVLGIVMKLGVDIVAVRGAVCEGYNRKASVNAARVSAIAKRLSACMS